MKTQKESLLEALTNLLVWHDPNGIYTDDDCMANGIELMTLDMAVRLATDQQLIQLPAEDEIENDIEWFFHKYGEQNILIDATSLFVIRLVWP